MIYRVASEHTAGQPLLLDFRHPAGGTHANLVPGERAEHTLPIRPQARECCAQGQAVSNGSKARRGQQAPPTRGITELLLPWRAQGTDNSLCLSLSDPVMMFVLLLVVAKCRSMLVIVVQNKMPHCCGR